MSRKSLPKLAARHFIFWASDMATRRKESESEQKSEGAAP